MVIATGRKIGVEQNKCLHLNELLQSKAKGERCTFGKR